MHTFVPFSRGVVMACALTLALAACSTRAPRPETTHTLAPDSGKTREASEPVAASAEPKIKGGRERVPRAATSNGVFANNDIMTIHTLPVGAGNCQVLQCPSQDKIVMFDCGSLGGGTQNWSEQKVVDYVDGLIGQNTEVVIAVSHTDGDHNNYLPAVFKKIYVHDIVIAQRKASYPKAVREWMDREQTHGATVWSWKNPYTGKHPDDELSCWAPDGNGGWDMDVRAYVLGVNAAGGANSASLVVSETYDDFQAVFTGDMTKATEDLINSDLHVTLSDTDMITGAHHGADTYGSNSATWTAANQAMLVVFSAGTRHYHPRCDAVDRYLPYLDDGSTDHAYHCGDSSSYKKRNTDADIVVTDDNGLIKVTSDGQTYNYTWTVSGTGSGDAVNSHKRQWVTRDARN